MYKLEIKRWNRNLRIPKSYIFTCENITFLYFHITCENITFSKRRKIAIPLHTPFLLYKSGVQGGIHYTDMFS